MTFVHLEVATYKRQPKTQTHNKDKKIRSHRMTKLRKSKHSISLDSPSKHMIQTYNAMKEIQVQTEKPVKHS